jgi:hypothetical protein
MQPKAVGAMLNEIKLGVIPKQDKVGNGTGMDMSLGTIKHMALGISNLYARRYLFSYWSSDWRIWLVYNSNDNQIKQKVPNIL